MTCHRPTVIPVTYRFSIQLSQVILCKKDPYSERAPLSKANKHYKIGNLCKSCVKIKIT